MEDLIVCSDCTAVPTGDDAVYSDGWQRVNGEWFCPNCRDSLLLFDDTEDEVWN